MMRNSVVLPEPDGPSKATSFPLGTTRSTLLSALKAPKVLVMPVAIILMVVRSRLGASLLEFPFDEAFQNERDDRQDREERSHGERTDKVVFVVENLDV